MVASSLDRRSRHHRTGDGAADQGCTSDGRIEKE
jgi:hypothetical protein